MRRTARPAGSSPPGCCVSASSRDRAWRGIRSEATFPPPAVTCPGASRTRRGARSESNLRARKTPQIAVFRFTAWSRYHSPCLGPTRRDMEAFARDPRGCRLVPMRLVRLCDRSSRARPGLRLSRVRWPFLPTLVAVRRPSRAHDRHEVEGPPDWLDEARESLVRGATASPSRTTSGCGSCPLQDGWTRIGRSLSANVRFDDPTVSTPRARVQRRRQRGADSRRPQPERRLPKWFPGRARRTRGRRRDRDRPLHPVLRQPRRLAQPVEDRRRDRPSGPAGPSRSSPRSGEARLAGGARIELGGDVIERQAPLAVPTQQHHRSASRHATSSQRPSGDQLTSVRRPRAVKSDRGPALGRSSAIESTRLAPVPDTTTAARRPDGWTASASPTVPAGAGARRAAGRRAPARPARAGAALAAAGRPPSTRAAAVCAPGFAPRCGARRPPRGSRSGRVDRRT